jgi:type IX secretion system PorP/SprF family membrane protein
MQMILYRGRFYLLLVFLFFTISNSFGQDPHFSQFYANPLYLNPAFAGTANCPRFILNFRDQYPAYPKNYLTFSGGYDQYIPEIQSGIGLLVTGNIDGKAAYQNYYAGAIYNFRVKATHQLYLQFALQGNFVYTAINWEKWKFASDIINPSAPSEFPDNQNKYQSKSQVDVAFGFMGYTSYLYFGLAVHHLLPLQKSFLHDPKKIWEPKWTAHVGGKVTIIQKIKDEVNFGDIFFHPNIVFMSQGKYHYLHEGFYFNFYPLTVGTWLRHNFKNCDAFIISCGVEYKIFKIGYSYDFNLNKLERTGGSHEVSLQIIIPCNTDKMDQTPKRKSSKYSPVACPCF